MPNAIVPTKSLWASKTFWVNTLTGLAVFLVTLAGPELIAAYPRVAGVLATVAAGINIGLRYVSAAKIE